MQSSEDETNLLFGFSGNQLKEMLTGSPDVVVPVSEDMDVVFKRGHAFPYQATIIRNDQQLAEFGDVYPAALLDVAEKAAIAFGAHYARPD
jgi:hypothetical protein